MMADHFHKVTILSVIMMTHIDFDQKVPVIYLLGPVDGFNAG